MSELGEAAERLAAHGIPVVPCEVMGKKPLFGMSYRNATTDPAMVQGWWSDEPEANIAIRPGGAELVVLDYDGSHGIERAGLLGLPATARVMVATPGNGGGRHLYFRLPEGAPPIGNVSTFDRQGVNVKSSLGLVTVPPSVHPNGMRYEWVGKAVTDVGAVEPVPIMVYERFLAWERRQSGKRRMRFG